VIDLPVARLRDDAILPSQAYEGDVGSTSPPRADRSSVQASEGSSGQVSRLQSRGVGGPRAARPARRQARNHSRQRTWADRRRYRGEVKVIILNTDKRESFVVEPGMRIAQLVLVEAAGVRLVELDELSISERGAAGLGSSG
jgi:dUTP pyrophosphatase